MNTMSPFYSRKVFVLARLRTARSSLGWDTSQKYAKHAKYTLPKDTQFLNLPMKTSVFSFKDKLENSARRPESMLPDYGYQKTFVWTTHEQRPSLTTWQSLLIGRFLHVLCNTCLFGWGSQMVVHSRNRKWTSALDHYIYYVYLIWEKVIHFRSFQITRVGNVVCFSFCLSQL